MRWETTTYFDTVRPIKHPEVTREQAFYVAENYVLEEEQPDGRIRRWGYVEELRKYVRVILESDVRTLHNAFIDRGFRP